jgi:hypothetical protein
MTPDRIQINEFSHHFQCQLGSANHAHVGEWLREHLPYLSGPAVTTFHPIFGPPGTMLTLRGHQFSAVCEENLVEVGGKPARVVAASPTELTVVSARDIQDGPVTVTVGGRGASGPVDFNVTGFPEAGIGGDWPHAGFAAA